MLNSMIHQKTNLLLIFLWPVFASVFSFMLKANFFVSTLLFFGVPAAYLSYRNAKFVKKTALFSLILGIPLTIIIDYIMETTGGWFIPHSIFDPFRIFNRVTVDIIVWGVLYVYFITIYYETFLDKHVKTKQYYNQMKYLIISLIITFGLFILIKFAKPELLYINYFYLIFGTVLGILPIALVLFSFPQLYGKFFKAGAYFFFLTFIYEVTALQLNQWSFPAKDQFIGFVDIVGIRFPFEEFFFWILLGALGILSFYEFFDDDRK